MPRFDRRSLPIWSLPAAAALLPLIATGLAFWLSVAHGHIEACNPFWDGCTSISRAARHGSGNAVFRALMLPCALLQVLVWRVARSWLASQARTAPALLATLGLVAGMFLILYTGYLGTDGDFYRLLRRYGVTVYFAATYLALLMVLRSLHRPPPDIAYRPLLVVALGMLALGLASTSVSAFVVDAALKDRLENVLEWQLGLWLTAMFAVLAWRWRDARVQLGSPG